MLNLFYLLLSFSLFFSCSNRSENTKVASVDKYDLLLSDIVFDMPENIEDSSYFVQYYIDQWIRQKIMLYHAELNLNVNSKDIEKKIDDYKSSLLIHAYQEQLINQNFDTSVSNKDIHDYYNQFINEFRLRDNIFKGRYIIVDKAAPRLDELNRLYNSDFKEGIKDLDNYCQQFAKEYFLSDSVWILFSNVTKKIPNEIKDEDFFLRNNKSLYLEDNNYRYYIYIKEYKMKGAISPLELEFDRIKNVLLNKNKINYLSNLEDELFQDGIASDKIKIYK